MIWALLLSLPVMILGSLATGAVALVVMRLIAALSKWQDSDK